MSFNRFPSFPSVTSLFSTVPQCHLKSPPPPSLSATLSVLTSAAQQRSRFAPSRRLSLCSTNSVPRSARKRRQSETRRTANNLACRQAVRLAVVLQVVTWRSFTAFSSSFQSPFVPIFSLLFLLIRPAQHSRGEDILCRMRPHQVLSFLQILRLCLPVVHRDYGTRDK